MKMKMKIKTRIATPPRTMDREDKRDRAILFA